MYISLLSAGIGCLGGYVYAQASIPRYKNLLSITSLRSNKWLFLNILGVFARYLFCFLSVYLITRFITLNIIIAGVSFILSFLLSVYYSPAG